MYLATMGFLGWMYLLSKAQRNRRKGRICKIPHSTRGCGGDDGGDQIQIQQVPLAAPQQQINDLFQNIQIPYTASQYKMYQDVYQPMTKELGGILGDQLKQPMTLPEDVWNNIWQQSKANTIQGFNEQRQTGSERLAGKGMLNQPVSEKYFQNLDLAQGKSLENLSVDMAIQKWQEQKAAKQLSISNMSNFLTGQPNFNITPQIPQYYSQMPQQTNWITGAKQGTTGGMISDLAFGQNQDQALQLAMMGAMMA